MTYNEATETTVTYSMAKKEIELHSCSMSDFIAEYGRKDNYEGSDVLAWLGY